MKKSDTVDYKKIVDICCAYTEKCIEWGEKDE